jgi:hypothetical protein
MEVAMGRLRLLIPSLALTFLALALISCGSSSKKLGSISITPAVADAKDFPNGQVKYTAAGTYSDGSQVKPLPVMWSAGPPWVATSWDVKVDGNGIATCGTSPAGTYPVWAGAPTSVSTSVTMMNQSTPMVTATAQLTCP